MLVSDGVIVWEVQEEDGKEIARAMRGYHYLISCINESLVINVGQPLAIQLAVKDWQGNTADINTNLIVRQDEDNEINIPVVNGIAEFDFVAEYVGKIQLIIRSADVSMASLTIEVIVE